MSYIGEGRIFDSNEIELIESLDSLGVSGTNQGIAKTSSTTFENRTFGGSSATAWGAITGTLSNQTDLQTALNAKQNLATNLTSLSSLAYSSLSFVKMSAAGTFSLDTNIYLTGNQTITLSGDISGSGATSITTTLATVNSNVGTFGSATQSTQITANAKGLITAIANVTITPAVGSLTGRSNLVGTSNQVTLSASGTNALVGGNNITLSLPQDIATGSSPTFTGLTLSGLTSDRILFVANSGAIGDDSTFLWTDAFSANRTLVVGGAIAGSRLDVKAGTNQSAMTVQITTSGYGFLSGYDENGNSRLGLGPNNSFWTGVPSTALATSQNSPGFFLQRTRWNGSGSATENMGFSHISLGSSAGNSTMWLFDDVGGNPVMAWSNSGSKAVAINDGAPNSPTTKGQFFVSIADATYPGIVIQGASSQSADLQRWNNSSSTTLVYISSLGVIMPRAGSATAGTAPIKFTSGTLLTSAEAGAMEFLTDKWYATITTGAARKEFTLNDATLTPGVVPVATTNGRLTDSTLTATKITKPLFDHFTNGNNVTTGETDLYSDTIVAGQLGTNADKIFAQYGGTFVGDATSTQRIKAYFGGTLIFDTGALGIGVTTANWDIGVTIIRVSSSVVRCSVCLTSSFATLNAYDAYTEVTGLTLANTQILKITGTAAGVTAASDQISAKEGYVQFLPAA